MSQLNSEDTSALLARLSQKPGVQSTLILKRTDGAIVRASGLVSSVEGPSPDSTLPTSPGRQSAPPQKVEKPEKGLKNAEDVARMVWSFFAAAGSLAQEMEEEDEVKLLRLRTKKHELVIVPDSKFLLVVIHDTPPA